MPNITIDGKPYSVKDGLTLIEAIDEAKIGLPRYCYHPALSIAGNCRICQVEVEKMPRTVIACNTRVAEGMVVHTQSPKAKESQQVVLEFLLANHPLDCPVCDQAGECKLQDYYMRYGLYDPTFDDVKVKKKKKASSIGPHVMLDQERCILCSRCVRFADEITKTSDFGIFHRGDHASVDVYPGQQIDNPYSGNVVDLCPVGALTDKDFRFKMRVWYLGSQDSICPGCSRGCNIQIHFEKSRPVPSKKGRVMRLKPRVNPEVNRWWICDAGRYSYKSIDENRLQNVQVSDHGLALPKTWDFALEKVTPWLKQASPERWGLILSAQMTNEELYLAKKLFKDHLGWKNIAFYSKADEGFGDDFLIQKDKNPNTLGARHILKLGASEDVGPLIEKAAKGALEGLFVFHRDLAVMPGLKHLIFQGPNRNRTSEAAQVVLPAASYAEKDGTFTNFQGRVQKIRKAIEPIQGSKPCWEILTALGVRLGLAWNYDKPEAIFNDLAKESDAFKNLNYKKIGCQGALWNASEAASSLAVAGVQA